MKAHGAAVVVLAVDDDGQAATYGDRRACVSTVAISCKQKLFSSQRTVVYDCNVPTVASGLKGHTGCAVNFIQAVARLNTNLPFEFVLLCECLGILSFPKRGLTVPTGLNMSFANPSGCLCTVTFTASLPNTRNFVSETVC